MRMRGGYTTLYKGSMVLQTGRFGCLERLGEFCMLFVEEPNMSNMQWNLPPTGPTGTGIDPRDVVPSGSTSGSRQSRQQQSQPQQVLPSQGGEGTPS